MMIGQLPNCLRVYEEASPEAACARQSAIWQTGETAILGCPATTRGPRWAAYLNGTRLPGDAPCSWSWGTRDEAQRALVAALAESLRLALELDGRRN